MIYLIICLFLTMVGITAWLIGAYLEALNWIKDMEKAEALIVMIWLVCFVLGDLTLGHAIFMYFY